MEGGSREVEGGWESGEFNASVSPPEWRWQDEALSEDVTKVARSS